MQRRIRILPDHVANQIAAGEVIERPASAVKELVENSLDAHATRIDIEIRNGGKTELRVADDGHGMVHDDALLAIDRHATSKIADERDLSAIKTLGFRGEALPSIAAVSRFQLETAPDDGGAGTRVRIEGGRVAGVDEIARQPGTTVSVRSLFFNVPARAKFLRSAAAETRAISDVVTDLALAHPGVAFRLTSNDRELLDTPGVDDLISRIVTIWGDELASQLLPLDHTSESIRLAGLIQRPADTRPGTRRTHLFVNGRPFEDRFVVRAAEAGYRTTIPRGHRPALFLFIHLPPDQVDVNVHPTKAEVRFRDKIGVEKTLSAAVRATLEGLDSSPDLGPGAGQLVGAKPEHESWRPHHRPLGGDRPAGQMAFFVPDPGTESEADERRPGEVGDESPYRPDSMWQVHNSYILCETRGGLIIVDQHSAHERVLFERIMRGFESKDAPSQRLLFPLTVRLSPSEFQALEEIAGVLHETGFELEPFGSNTVIIHSVPSPHRHFDAERCFREMISELADGSPLVDSAHNQHERVAMSFACKGAIKAGQALSQEEMVELFDGLFATQLPGHDVHGRPTVLRLSLDELARRFGRS